MRRFIASKGRYTHMGFNFTQLDARLFACPKPFNHDCILTYTLPHDRAFVRGRGSYSIITPKRHSVHRAVISYRRYVNEPRDCFKKTSIPLFKDKVFHEEQEDYECRIDGIVSSTPHMLKRC